MAAIEQFNSRHYEQSYGGRRAVRIYRVDSSGDPVVAALDPQLPVRGEAYPGDPTLIVVDIFGDRSPTSLNECTFQVRYGTMGFHAPSPREVDDPASVEEQLEIGTSVVTMTNDRNGLPIGPFEMEGRRGVPVEVPYTRLTITRWESGPDEMLILNMTPSVNDATWRHRDAGCWLFRGAFMEQCQPGKYQATYTFDLQLAPKTSMGDPIYPPTDGWWGWKWCWYDRDFADVSLPVDGTPHVAEVYDESDFDLLGL